jgi:DNA-binding response OmpR family regulator
MTETLAPLILIVDNNEALCAWLSVALAAVSYRVICAATGSQGLMASRKQNPDLLLLDWDLPDMSALQICRRLQQSSDIPIIMLTAHDQAQERVKGLDSGADDVLTKPFELEELLASIRARLRRRHQAHVIWEWQGLSLNEQTHRVSWEDQPLELTPKEFDLLKAFLKQPEQVLERTGLIQQVWGWTSDGHDKVLDLQIHSLREKLEALMGKALIHTVRGIGYVLRDSP